MIELKRGFWYNTGITKPNERKKKMTQVDKTEIQNLLASVGTMKRLANELNAPYNDANIAKYALDALNDAKETKAYIISVIQDNIGMFIDLNNVTITESFGTSCIKNFLGEHTLVYRLGDLLKIKLNVFEFKIKEHTYGKLVFSANPDDMEVVNVWIHTSDTSLKADNWGHDNTIYHLFACSCDLYFGIYDGGFDKRYIQDFNPNGKYSAEFWNRLHKCADRTRAKADILLKELKFQITAKLNGFKVMANKNEEYIAANSKVGVYVKIM